MFLALFPQHVCNQVGQNDIAPTDQRACTNRSNYSTPLNAASVGAFFARTIDLRATHAALDTNYPCDIRDNLRKQTSFGSQFYADPHAVEAGVCLRAVL